MSMSLQELIRLEEKKRTTRLQKDALARAKEVAAFLKNKYGVRKVFLYGSLARGRFSHHSDIDLYVEGFNNVKDYWRMQVEAEGITQPYPLSIVLAEDALPSLHKTVYTEGVELS